MMRAGLISDFLVDLAVVIMKSPGSWQRRTTCPSFARILALTGMYDRNLVASALLNLTPLAGEN